MVKFDISWTKKQTIEHYGEKVVNSVCVALHNLGIDYPIFFADRVDENTVYQIEHPESLCVFLEFAMAYDKANKSSYDKANKL